MPVVLTAELLQATLLVLIERSTLLYLFGGTDSGLGVNMENQVWRHGRLSASRRELVENWALCIGMKQRVERRSQVVGFPP